jgi:hypothetical protein
MALTVWIVRYLRAVESGMDGGNRTIGGAPFDPSGGGLPVIVFNPCRDVCAYGQVHFLRQMELADNAPPDDA